MDPATLKLTDVVKSGVMGAGTGAIQVGHTIWVSSYRADRIQSRPDRDILGGAIRVMDRNARSAREGRFVGAINATPLAASCHSQRKRRTFDLTPNLRRKRAPPDA
jgi:hypothetical protein